MTSQNLRQTLKRAADRVQEREAEQEAGVEAVPQEEKGFDLWTYVQEGGRLMIRPTSWQVLIEPHAPPKMVGRFHIAEGTQRIQEIHNHIGRVIAFGPTCFEGKTASGIDISRIADEISEPKELLGRWVVYQRHTGQSLTLARPVRGKKVLLATGTEILALVDDPADFAFWL